MPMGIVSDEEFEFEVSRISSNSNSNSVNKSTGQVTTEITEITGEIRDVTRGRGKGNVEVPNSLRKLIGEESAIHGRESALELARDFGISASSTSAYNKGATSTASYNQPNQSNLSHIISAKERVSKRARAKLIAALNHITEDKLEVAKVGELSAVARNMSAIVKDMEPESKSTNNMNQPTFIFYSPQTKKEEHFDIIKLPE